MTSLKGIRSKAELLGVILTLVSFAVYLYFGSSYKILNTAVIVFMLLSVCVTAIGVWRRNNWLAVVGEVLLAVATLYFVRDSIATFVDWYNGTAMFGGTGRMDLVFTILGFAFAAILIEIISCFMKDKE